MGDAPDFIQKFHNLEGDLLSVRKKNLYKLLQTTSLFNNENQLSALENLAPKNYQEHIFYIDILVYFKRTNKLLELLKSGNDLYAKKILKERWFFEAAFKDIHPDKLANELLPFLSYTTRKKCITNILQSWKSEQIDLLFDAIDKKYGLTVAIPILHKCTPVKIKSVLDDNEVRLRPNQVLQLLNVDENCFKFYLGHINSVTRSIYDERKVLQQLALKNPQLYLELLNANKIRSDTLGKRTTKKIVPLVKEELFKDSEPYFRFLNKAVTIRKLGLDFERIYKNVFPTKFKSISSYCTSTRLLEYYSKRRRWALFLKTCNEKFSDKNLDEVLPLFSSQLKNLYPPKEIILKWAEIYYNKQEGNFEDYLKYYEPAKAIPIIKEKINVTKEIYRRLNLIKLMINSCAEHKDFAGLQQVLQYICSRHRNEDSNFRNSILNQINACFKLEELNENHWKYINEQIKILKIQKEFQFFVNAKLVEKHLEFLFKNKMEHKEYVKEYVTELLALALQKRGNYRLLELNNKPIEKEIYTAIGNIYLESANKDYEQIMLQGWKIFVHILNFSINNPEYCVDLAEFPDFFNVVTRTFTQTINFNENTKYIITKVLTYNFTCPKYAVPIEDSKILDLILMMTEKDKSLYCFSGVLQKFVQKKNRTPLENSMLLLYFDKLFEPYPQLNIVNWFLNNEPLILVPYFDQIVRSSVKTYDALDFKILRHYSHLNFDKKICKYYKNKLDDKIIEDKKKLMVALSILLSTDDFLKLVEEKYLPKKDKLDMEDKEMLEMYKLQCEIVKLLAEVPDPYKTLPIIMKFCKGDYLQTALKPLYKAFYRSPERLLYSYVETLSKMAVSVRKHAVFLSCEVLDKEHTLKVLKNTSEGNVSSQKHLFSAILKYFLKNPSRDLLQKLIESMNTIDINDVETLDSLRNVIVPFKYRAEYLEKCWRYFESLKPRGIKIEGYLEKLLRNMQGDIMISLPTDFIVHLMTNYCLLAPAVTLSNTNDFLVEVLKLRTTERTQHFNLIFDSFSKPNVNLIIVENFFNSFIGGVNLKTNVDQNLVNLFALYWNKYFTTIDFLSQHIQLNLRILRFSNSSVENYARSVVDALDKLISEFGVHVFNHFKNVFREIVEEMDQLEYFSLVLAILQYKLDENTCMLVLKLVSSNSVTTKSTFDKIFELIGTVEFPIVRAYRSEYLRHHNDK